MKKLKENREYNYAHNIAHLLDKKYRSFLKGDGGSGMGSAACMSLSRTGPMNRNNNLFQLIYLFSLFNNLSCPKKP